MTSYSHTVTFSDIEIISLGNIIDDQIKTFKEVNGESLPVPYWWIDILDKLKNAQIELASYTSYEADGKPTIHIKT